ncbi:MAG: hypothetical protein RR073_00325 [Clostridia bacterium]
MIAVIKLLTYEKNRFINRQSFKKRVIKLLDYSIIFYEICILDTAKKRQKLYKKILLEFHKNDVNFFYTKDSILKSYLIYKNYTFPNVNQFLYLKMSGFLEQLFIETKEIIANKTAVITANANTNVFKENLDILVKYFGKVIILTKAKEKYHEIADFYMKNYGIVIVVLNVNESDFLPCDFALLLSLENIILPQNTVIFFPNIDNKNLSKNIFNSFSYNLNYSLSSNISSSKSSCENSKISSNISSAKRSSISSTERCCENSNKSFSKSCSSSNDDLPLEFTEYLPKSVLSAVLFYESPKINLKYDIAEIKKQIEE